MKYNTLERHLDIFIKNRFEGNYGRIQYKYFNINKCPAYILFLCENSGRENVFVYKTYKITVRRIFTYVHVGIEKLAEKTLEEFYNQKFFDKLKGK